MKTTVLTAESLSSIGQKRCRSCYDKSRERRVRCERCGIWFKATPSQHRKYCSKNCEALSKTGAGNHFFGKQHTKETKKLISQANKGRQINAGADNPNWKGGNSQTKEYRSRKWKEWVEKNREYVNWKNAQRRALRKNAEGSFTLEEWGDLKEKCDYVCQKCGKKEPEIKLTIDHIIPLSKGGSNYISNIQPLCGTCNTKKYNHLE